jgi:hypothetical protein
MLLADTHFWESSPFTVMSSRCALETDQRDTAEKPEFCHGAEVGKGEPYSGERPWQSLLTGDDIGQIDDAARHALERILELFTEVGGLVVCTVAVKCEARKNANGQLGRLRTFHPTNCRPAP